jgi:hypothetical protein
VGEAAVRAQPREHPVDHAEQQHRQRPVELVARQVRTHRGDRVGEGGHHAALRLLHLEALVFLEEAHVLGQHAVLVLRVGVLAHEAQDQRAQPHVGIGVGGLAQHLEHELLQPRHVAHGDLEQQLALVAVVVVEAGLRGAAGRGDVVHRRGRVAVVGEQLRGPREDRVALVVVGGGASAGHESFSDDRTRCALRRWSDAPGT